MIRFKLKKVYSFESLGSGKLLTVNDVIGAYQRKMINYYLNLCIHQNKKNYLMVLLMEMLYSQMTLSLYYMRIVN